MLRVICTCMILLILNVYGVTYGKDILSGKAIISVITCSPGEEVYSIFGHTAIRVKDPIQGIDWVYNYGTFDFDTPNFYWEFSKGNLLYFLSVSHFQNFLHAYQSENRVLEEQVLNLSSHNKQKIYDLLQQDLLVENRFYRYQFFKDNCTTRVYNLLKEALDSPMQIDTTYIVKKESFRELFNTYVDELPWVKMGMNLGLGLPADHKASFDERMYLPLELKYALDHAYNAQKPLVLRSQLSPILFLKNAEDRNSFSISPLLLFSSLAVIVCVLSICFIGSRQLYIIDVLIFGSTSLAGFILLYLWIFSLHTPTHQNLNLLWMSPLNIILLLNFRQSAKFKSYYLKYYLSLIALLILINIFYSYYIIEFFPLSIIILARLISLYHKDNSLQTRRGVAIR